MGLQFASVQWGKLCQQERRDNLVKRSSQANKGRKKRITVHQAELSATLRSRCSYSPMMLATREDWAETDDCVRSVRGGAFGEEGNAAYSISKTGVVSPEG